MNSWLILALLAFLQTLLLGVLLVPLARRSARRLGLVDAPNLARKQHDRPIPRSGGMAVFGAFWLCLLGNFLIAALVIPGLDFLPADIRTLAGNVGMKVNELSGLFAGCFIIFALGLLDDRFNLSPRVRLVVQIAACVPLLMSGVVLKMFLPTFLAWPLTIFWLVLLTNSFNFLDNMNGLTSGVSAIICLVLGTMAFLSQEWFMLLIFALLAGAVLAFWFFNFPKASIFLGDCGSTHLGFLLGALSILTTYYQQGVPTKLPILIPLIVLGVPLFDTLSVLWIRWSSGKPLMQGDTNHLSHRLAALGMSRTEAVLFIYLATAVVGMLAMPLRYLEWTGGIIQALAIALIFFLLHWLERVSYRRRVAPSSS